MPGRHSSDSETGRPERGTLTWILAALAGLLVVVGGVFACTKITGGCGALTPVTVAADPAIAPAVTRIVAARTPEQLSCSRVKVDAIASAGVLGTVTKPGAPTLWIPDSALWISRLSRTTGQLPQLASQSLAATPAVVAARAGEQPFFADWLSVLRTKGLRFSDPLSTGAGLAALGAALAEAERGKTSRSAVSAALVPIAQAQAAAVMEPSAQQRLSGVDRDGGLAVATEQEVLRYQRDNPGARLTAPHPETGTVFLNFPLAITAAAGPGFDEAKSAGEALSAALSAADAKAAYTELGLRTADQAPLQGRGTGAVRALNGNDPAAFNAVLKGYAAMALPIRTLAVVDVSGSMSSVVPGGSGTRMELTMQAAQAGIERFTDNSQGGLWAFSTDKGGPGQDWKELVPIRRMSDDVGGVRQRAVMNREIGKLGALVGGATGLYDTTLAAFRKVKEAYDPKAVNSVIILTDGANDDPGSPGLDQLLETLRGEQDPAKPVIILTIGITRDADAPVLQRIAAATGGTSYIATNPADIENVYVQALQARYGR